MKETIQKAQASADLRSLPKAPTGIHGLDEVTEGGLPRGRPTLVCGPAGCGKTLMALEFLVRGITEYGENGVFMAFEETREDLIANVASLGFDLRQLEADGKLALDHVSIDPGEVEQSGEWDLEGLFIRLGASIDAVGADRVVIDTIENLFGAFSDSATLRAELRRLFRWLKERGVTAVITGERNRSLSVLKARGMAHSNQIREFLLTEHGIEVADVHRLGEKEVLTGSARLAQDLEQGRGHAFSLDVAPGDGAPFAGTR